MVLLIMIEQVSIAIMIHMSLKIHLDVCSVVEKAALGKMQSSLSGKGKENNEESYSCDPHYRILHHL
jgi:hypothetical protein